MGAVAVLISILIPCFNAERWIGGAIDSALAQTWPEKEVVVVDDGSTDGSAAIVRGYGDRVRFESIANGGANRARNRLLALARGEWLQYLDADDYLLPEKIASQAPALGGSTDADVLYGPVTVEAWSADSVTREISPIPEPRDPWILLARWRLPQTGSPLWRKRAIEDVGSWTPDQPCAQEHELYLRLLIGGKKFVYQPDNGAVYRFWTAGSVSRRNDPELRRRRSDILRRAQAHLSTIGELTAARLTAINMTRFEMARQAWVENRAEAHALADEIHRSQPSFVPSGPAAPLRYRVIYQTLGFDRAEQFATVLRGIRRS